MVRVIVLLPPTLLGAVALLPAVPVFPAYANLRLPYAFEILTVTAQLAVLVGWLSVAVLAGAVKRGGALNDLERTFEGVDPRGVFYAGVALHAVVFAITSALPADTVVSAARITSALLAAVLFASGIYTASRVPDGPIQIRLAGTLHSVADALKLFIKEDFVPKNADRLLHALAPMIALFPALVTMAVLPFGSPVCLEGNQGQPLAFDDFGHMAHVMGRDFICRGHAVGLQVADLNVGILYMFAMGGTGVVGAALAGWASDNKFSLLGGLRAASQMVSYEVAMGLSLVGALHDLRHRPARRRWSAGRARTRGASSCQPFAFFLFLAALVAETKRIPFDLPEAESELVAGYFIEYSGMKFGMFYFAEYMEVCIRARCSS